MTVEELKYFAKQFSMGIAERCKSTGETLGITENVIYIDKVDVGVHDGRSSGYESSLRITGTLICVDEDHIIKYLSEYSELSQKEVSDVFSFFAEKHYVSFQLVSRVIDISPSEFLKDIQDNYGVKLVFILDGTLNLTDEEDEIKIKARLQYADKFTCYGDIAEIFEYSKTHGNSLEFTTLANVAAKKNAFVITEQSTFI